MSRYFRLPSIAANTVDAILEEWAVDVDSSFAAGDVLFTVETDKALVEITADTDGVLARRLVDAGDSVQVGAPVAVIAEEGEALDAGPPVDDRASTHEADPVPERAPVAPGGQASAPSEAAAAPPSARVFISPLARRLAAANGVPIEDLVGSGPRGRILRADVEGAVATRARQDDGRIDGASVAREPARTEAASAAGTAFEDIPHTRIRSAVAARLTQSKRDVPHFYLRSALRADRLAEVHSRMRSHGQPVSLTDLIVKAVARAHARVPAMNVIWQADSVRRFSSVDVAVAVAVDGGLVTPVVRDVDRRTVGSVSAELRDLADRARARRLQHDELVGGSITVSSLGMFGVQEFAAIINPPQSAILAVGAIRPEPVVDNDALLPGKVLRVTLSVDHRPVDGVVAAEWMRCLTELIEEPALLLG